jgi:hypothetical protein
MKILFINKSNNVSIQLISKMTKLTIDIHMFKYLICYIILKLHENHNKSINIHINLDKNHKDNQTESQ